MREIRYRAIADELRSRLEAGELAAGRVLPSEAELSATYRASRVTIRRALEVLRTEGLLDARQGFGWFVAADPLRQTLGRLGTIEGQLAESGLVPERRVLDFAFVAAEPRVRRALGCEQVLRVRRLNLADGEPFARVTVWCPAELGAELSRADVERSPFYELLAVPLGGATQTIGAAAASADDAALLGIPVGSPVLRCERVTQTVDGEPVLLSEHVFPAHRTEFVVDLPHVELSMAPTGLRLVEEPQ
ncbi:MAG: GntR family transcriptional regulator [Acidimicrobiales bacterium]|nr:GntR family transcriptional regulator [Acidimicrobiales bacterium]